MKLISASIILPILLASHLHADTARTDRLREAVRILASDEAEGRETGSPGEAFATEYIKRQMKAIGLKPLPGHDGFEVPFTFTAGMKDGGSKLSVRTKEGASVAFVAGKNFSPLAFSDSGTVEGELVFVGYGLTTAENAGLQYDSYVGLNVKDKIVLMFRYFPEDADDAIRGDLSRYSGLRYKAARARELGAKGVLVVTGPRSPQAGELVPMGLDTALAGSGIKGASIDLETARQLLAPGTDKTLEDLQKEFDSANPHISGFALPGVRISLDVEIQREKRTGNNLVGILDETDGKPLGPEPVVVGAHYDHLGRGRDGNSLAKKDEAGQIHHGADDNASGVSVVLETARTLANDKETLKRPVMFAFWSGEESGLLGSTDFLRGGTVKPEELHSYVNFDMVGRAKDDKLAIQAVGSSSVWKPLIEKINLPIGFDITLSDDPYVPTDAMMFYEEKVPSVHFFTGNHEDYHRPTDTADKLNYEFMDELTDFGARMVSELAASPKPDYKTVTRTSVAGTREGMRAYTGTIPDYTAEVQGLRLSGVIGGGPAEAAGLKEGDVIVSFNGKEIKNIYDYTYALDSVKIGKVTPVVIMRDGKRMEVSLTPTARK